MELSIVSTLYRSSPYIMEFHRRATEAARQFASEDYELVLVNDGSPDESLDFAVALARRDPRVVVVDLSRNFGHHKAMMTGLAHARGQHVFLIDCDLEEDPQWLASFGEEMRRGGADMVFGQQSQRKGNWFERVSGSLFYTALNRLSIVPIPRNAVTARLMTRRYVDSLTQHRDREVFLLGLLCLTGYQQQAIQVVKSSKGQSTYSLGRKLSVLVNAITSFSNRPLVFIFYLGMMISLLSLCGAAILILRWMLYGQLLMGWPSLIVSVWLLGGFTILCLGIIGVYLAKIFTEVKERPYSIVRAVHRTGDDANSRDVTPADAAPRAFEVSP